jgi:hypothetical protein
MEVADLSGEALLTIVSDEIVERTVSHFWCAVWEQSEVLEFGAEDCTTSASVRCPLTPVRVPPRVACQLPTRITLLARKSEGAQIPGRLTNKRLFTTLKMEGIAYHIFVSLLPLAFLEAVPSGVCGVASCSFLLTRPSFPAQLDAPRLHFRG